MAPSDDKPFEPIHNPYIVGNPIRGTKMFFGREDDFAYVQSKITGGDEGGLIVLCGARRSGKTSILFQIQDGRLGEGFLPVLIDMQSMAITSDADFLGKVAQAIMTSGYEFSDSHLSTYFLEQKDNPYDAFERFIKRLADELGETKLVLTFDEYELLETHIDNNLLKTQVLHLVGNLIEHKKLFVIFTGSDKLEARKRKYWDILSKGLNRRISFLSRNDTLRLVREPLRGVIEYEQGVPEAIADLTAGQPFYAQVLCQTIVDHLNEEQKYDVTNEDLLRVVNEVIVNPLPQMIFHWNQLPFIEKLCLSFIAEICRQELMPVTASDIAEFAQKENLGYQIDVNGLKKALENLFKGDLLVKSAESDKYEFKMGLWRLWITRMHSMWQVVDEMERAGEVPPELVPAQKPKMRRWVYASVSVIVVVAAIVLMRGLITGDDRGPASSPSQTPIDYAKLNIMSTPSNAEVWIDGARIGWTPLNDSIPVGTHGLKVTRAGYVAFADSLDLKAGASWDTTLALIDLTGDIDVQSRPSGARIILDGTDTGLRTPDRLPGLSVNQSYSVSLAIDGYDRYTFPPFWTFADSSIELSRDMTKKTSPLRIHSEPQGAAFVLSDGNWRGTTPYAILDVEYGHHVLSVTANGYKDWSETIEIPYANNEIIVTLERLPDGYFEFKIEPVADVYLDGTRVLIEISHAVISARPGEQEIELRYGEHAKKFTKTLAPGDTLTIKHNFTN